MSNQALLGKVLPFLNDFVKYKPYETLDFDKKNKTKKYFKKSFLPTDTIISKIGLFDTHFIFLLTEIQTKKQAPYFKIEALKKTC